MLPPTRPDLPPDAEPLETGLPAGARCAVHADRHALAVCARCGSFACTTCAHVLASGETVCAACEEKSLGSLPWERRGEIGLVRALRETIAGVLLRPGAFFAQRSRERSLAPTIVFGLAMHMLGQVAMTVTNIAFIRETRAELRQTPFAAFADVLASKEWYLTELAASPIAFVVTLFLGAAIWWISLRAVGGLRRPFHVIVRALCYAQAVSVLLPLIAPLAHLGPAGEGFALAFALWSWGIQVVAVTRMQGIEIARGIGASLLWLALAGSLLCLVGVAALWGIASQIPIPGGM